MAAMTVVLVHGVPETARLWEPLRERLGMESVALSLPGFGCARPAGFGATKEEYARWLAESLRGLPSPVDVVGHDWGALITLRVVTGYDVDVRSWAVDVAELFHPEARWHERAQILQTPGAGEEAMRAARDAPVESPESFAGRLACAGVPPELALEMAVLHDRTMSECILDLYRSAVPNVAADWWGAVAGPTPSAGLVLLLPDPPEIENMAVEVARALGAGTARLGDLDHCWMAQDPSITAAVLREFWSGL
jgi:pimeloyl-ACP methyl ester carboxylesterase